jgi:hypothetical protein
MLGGAPEYTCRQSGNGSKGEWQDGSLECVISCDPGFTPSESVNATRMSSDLPCAPCDAGRFSFDGAECRECPEPNENKTRCSRCNEGLGPNADRTLCETCADPLVSLAGLCAQKSLSGQIEDLWEKQSDTAKGFEAVFTLLAFILLLCCCGRAAGKETALYYVPDLIVAALALVFVMGAVFGHKSQLVADGNYEDIPWDILCSVTTALSVLPVPEIIRRYKKKVRSLGKDLDRDLVLLPEHKTTLGPVGMALFVWGLIDLFIDVSFCYSLWHCSQPVLAGCVTVSLLVTTAMTWYLGYFTLKFIVKSDIRDPSPAREWVSANSVLGPMIVVASSSRLNSMSILRLKFCGKLLIDFPDSPDHRFFHFLRSSGMFHYLIEDIPHAVISLVALYGDEQLQCQPEVDLSGLPLHVDPQTLSRWALWVSLISMALGVVSKSFQTISNAITTDTSGSDLEDLHQLAQDANGDLISRSSLAAAVERIEQELAGSRGTGLAARLASMVTSNSSDDQDYLNPGRASRPRDSRVSVSGAE